MMWSNWAARCQGLMWSGDSLTKKKHPLLTSSSESSHCGAVLAEQAEWNQHAHSVHPGSFWKEAQSQTTVIAFSSMLGLSSFVVVHARVHVCACACSCLCVCTSVKQGMCCATVMPRWLSECHGTSQEHHSDNLLVGWEARTPMSLSAVFLSQSQMGQNWKLCIKCKHDGHRCWCQLQWEGHIDTSLLQIVHGAHLWRIQVQWKWNLLASQIQCVMPLEHIDFKKADVFSIIFVLVALPWIFFCFSLFCLSKVTHLTKLATLIIQRWVCCKKRFHGLSLPTKRNAVATGASLCSWAPACHHQKLLTTCFQSLPKWERPRKMHVLCWINNGIEIPLIFCTSPLAKKVAAFVSVSSLSALALQLLTTHQVTFQMKLRHQHCKCASSSKPAWRMHTEKTSLTSHLPLQKKLTSIPVWWCSKHSCHCARPIGSHFGPSSKLMPSLSISFHLFTAEGFVFSRAFSDLHALQMSFGIEVAPLWWFVSVDRLWRLFPQQTACVVRPFLSSQKLEKLNIAWQQALSKRKVWEDPFGGGSSPSCLKGWCLNLPARKTHLRKEIWQKVALAPTQCDSEFAKDDSLWLLTTPWQTIGCSQLPCRLQIECSIILGLWSRLRDTLPFILPKRRCRNMWWHTPTNQCHLFEI